MAHFQKYPIVRKLFLEQPESEMRYLEDSLQIVESIPESLTVSCDVLPYVWQKAVPFSCEAS